MITLKLPLQDEIKLSGSSAVRKYLYLNVGELAGKFEIISGGIKVNGMEILINPITTRLLKSLDTPYKPCNRNIQDADMIVRRIENNSYLDLDALLRRLFTIYIERTISKSQLSHTIANRMWLKLLAYINNHTL